ncbi:protein PAT1 homolog 1-like isoform X2 [Littorina saxatilis]|uniref:mRNA decay factor PAT1 domain-containing protein n=1 Tax=Littorina saxatilis TaxID=31220 RepID=A0AAN9GGS9_9CAEN
MENAIHVMSSSGMPALGLGAGIPGSHDNELIEAPEEEEEFDVLNDETFGNCEGDWDEEEHKRFAELEGESFFDLQPPDHTKDSGYGNAERSYRSQEEFLEQSISRLMEEEEDDKAKFFGKGQPIPFSGRQQQHGQVHLDQLFGPSSPPALLDTEHLVSPKSRNIWGTPSHDSQFRKPADALRKLFDTAKAGQRGAPSPAPQVYHPPMPTQSPVGLPQAHTLEEIERQMMSRSRTPQVITAEELERQMRGEDSPRGEYSRTPQVVNHHPQIGPPPQLPPGLLPASALTGEMPRSPFPPGMPPMPLPHHMAMHPPMTPPPGKPPTGMSPINQHPMANGRSSPINIKGLPPGQNLSSPMGRSSSTPTPPLVRGMPPHFQSPHPARLVSPYSIGNSPMAVNLASRMMTPPPNMPPHGHIPHGPIPHMPPMPNSPMGTPPHTRIPPPSNMQDMSPHSRSQQQHHHVVDRRQEIYSQHGNGEASDKHRAYRTNYQRPPPWQKNQPQRRQHQHPQQGEEVEDEYAGLMTQREKDWIIKIQLLQLNTDNPYLDDYYYTYYTLRKKQEESGHTDSMARFLIPNFAKIESRAYTPAQFEGSLGRLTTASVHNPRHIIDVSGGSSPSEDSSKKNVSKELRKFRQLLMDIEKGYILLLDVDDIEKKVFAVPEDSRLSLFLERHEKICMLYQYFTSDESIEQYMQILSVRKGRKLLARVLPLFTKNQAHVALCILFHHMQALVRKDAAEGGLVSLTRPVCRAMEGSDLESLVRLVNILEGEKPPQTGSYLQTLLKNQFSAAVLCGLLNQAEQVFKDTSPVDMDNQLQTEWSQFVEEFAEGLEKMALKDLPVATFLLPLTEAHLSRHLNAQLVGKVEEKVHRLTTPLQTTASSNAAS